MSASELNLRRRLTAQHIIIRLRGRTDRAWFSHFLRQPARKRSGSILTTPEPRARTGLPIQKQHNQFPTMSGILLIRLSTVTGVLIYLRPLAVSGNATTVCDARPLRCQTYD